MLWLHFQHALLETEANQIRASILDMAHCIRTFTDEVSEYSRKLVGIVQQIEGGEQIVEDGVGMAHTEHVRPFWIRIVHHCACLLVIKVYSLPRRRSLGRQRARVPASGLTSWTSTRRYVGRRRWR